LDDFLSKPPNSTIAASDDMKTISRERDAATVAASLWHMARSADSSKNKAVPTRAESRWKLEGRLEQLNGEIER
jgi:hypothetical protein